MNAKTPKGIHQKAKRTKFNPKKISFHLLFMSGWCICTTYKGAKVSHKKITLFKSV